MIAYWQLTPNGWVCSDVGEDYYYEPDEIPEMWHLTFYAANHDGPPIVPTDAMRYYPA